MHVAAASDTRLLFVGIAASLALVVYLAVAFAFTHPSSGSVAVNNVAPWVPHDSSLVAGRRSKEGDHVVRVTPRAKVYGALLPTLVAGPTPGRRYVVGLWLRGAVPGRIGVEVDEFRPGATSVYKIETTVRATAKWHHHTFRLRVKGSWLGLGMYVYRIDEQHRTWFEASDPTVSVLPH